MKAVILAGGKGTRIGEESQFKPKPMIEIGEKPILWHIMRTYSYYNINDFIICCGYKGHMIKEYFTEYHINNSDMRFNMETKSIEYLTKRIEPWKVTLANTGLNTLTAKRIGAVEKYLENEDTFMLTYGDGVADIDIDALFKFHKENGKCVTITVTKPEGRFGAVGLDYESNLVTGFKEKAREDQSLVNIGFMVCEKRVFDYLNDENEMLEAGPFERLVEAGEMVAYEHKGFWSPMDSMKDKKYLEGLWIANEAPWKR